MTAGHDAHHAEHGHDEAAHGTLRSYLTGFFLSVVLTAIPFWIVMGGLVSSKVATILILSAFAVAQIFVHMIYFLHMNLKSESGWSVMALAFTLVLVVIALSGSLWIMYHLNTNMMPVMPHDMRNMP